LHFLGDQPGARLHLERMLSQYVPPNHRSHIVRFQFDQRVSARMTLARVLWLQGFADQALREASSNIDEALAVDHTLSLCNALGNSACPVALFAGNLSAAERYTGMLSSLTERHGFDAWRAYADVFRGELLARRGELDSGLALLHTGVGKLRDAKFVQYQTAFLLMLAQSLVRAGRLEEGRAALDEALQQCKRTDERWCMSELLRVRGEIALLEPTPDRAAAERDFEAALVLARRQQALSWELRSAISLARLRRKEGRIAEARSLLAPVSGRFTEGFATADLRAANGLLTELA
jgi:predicted ATPase